MFVVDSDFLSHNTSNIDISFDSGNTNYFSISDDHMTQQQRESFELEQKRTIYDQKQENSSLDSSEDQYFKVRSNSAKYWRFYNAENKVEDEDIESISFGEKGLNFPSKKKIL